MRFGGVFVTMRTLKNVNSASTTYAPTDVNKNARGSPSIQPKRPPAFESAGLAASWTGVYDVTPDWNPVLGPVDGVPGLHLAYGFSGHGFKLSPIVGRLVANDFSGAIISADGVDRPRMTRALIVSMSMAL